MALDSLEEKGKIIKILDGGFSTQLSVHVGDKVDGDPLWSARFLSTDPSAVLATHLDFLRAGSDIIQTNTYQASVGGFMEHLGTTPEESLKLIASAVELAKEAVRIYSTEKEGVKRLIAGSVGPYGAAQHDGSEYTGAYDKIVTKTIIKDWHRPRLETLINGGVDLLAMETIPSKTEAEGLVELLQDYPQAKAWLSFSCLQDGKSLADGSSLKEIVGKCLSIALPGQIIAVGVNCIAPRCVAALLEQIKERGGTNVPLIVYPNSGEKYVVSKGWCPGDSRDPLEDFITDWLDIGVRYIGGCCRTYAKDITKIRDIVELWEMANLNHLAKNLEHSKIPNE